MANRTVKDAKSIKGTNPQYLIEKIIRSRIYDSKYWKEQCFALTAELLVDKAMEIRYVGGVYGGNIKPTPFLCLTLKMLQIQPEKDIIVEFIKNSDFKYVRALGAYYMRLTGTSLDCYKYLEPLLNDNRKLRRQNRNGVFELLYMDEFIDELLREERSCDVILPRIQKRYVLEEMNELQQRISLLDDDDEDEDESDEDDDDASPSVFDKSKKDDKKKVASKSSSRRRHHSHSGSRSRSHSDSAEEDRWSRDRRSNRDRDRDHDKRRPTDSSSRRRSRSRSRERDYDRDRRSNRDRDHDKRRPAESSSRRRSRSRERDYESERRRDRDHDKRRPAESSSRRRSRSRERDYDRDRKA